MIIEKCLQAMREWLCLRNETSTSFARRLGITAIFSNFKFIYVDTYRKAQK
jgi:hypothetical protein